MKSVEDVSYDTHRFEVQFAGKYIEFNRDNEIQISADYKARQGPSRWRAFEKMSKDELSMFQNVLLQTYVHLHDLLTQQIEDSESKVSLDETKGKIIVCRKHLKDITNYIDSYEDLLNQYRDI